MSANLKKPWKRGESGNPGGRPKSAPHMRKRCRDIVDEKVIDAWEKEVTARGDHWVKCSELLIAYGYGRPKLDSELVDEQIDRSERDGSGQLTLDEKRALARQLMLAESEADEDEDESEGADA